MNYRLADWFGVNVIEHKISPNTALPIADKSFDDFMIWHPTFYRQWREFDWDYLFNDLARVASGDEYSAYIRINQPSKAQEEEVLFPTEPLHRSVAKRDHSRSGKAYVLKLN